MQVGLGLSKGDDGKLSVVLTAVENDMQVAIALTGEENYEHHIDQLIAGLKHMKADMRREKSGLVLVKGGVPDGLRKPQGRKLNGPGSAS